MKTAIRPFLILAAAALVLPLSGCRKDNDRVTIVLDWTVNTNHTGIYAARDLGYFSDEGLDVDIEFPPETGAASMVLAGQAEFLVSYQEEVTMARASGKDLLALAAVIQHNTSGFASRKKANISRPRDFAGKTYGGWGSPMEEAVLKALMAKDGADYGRLKNVSVGSMDFFAATDSGIDFTWIFEGWDGVMAGIKGIDVNFIPLGTMEKALDYYTPVIASTDRYAADHQEIVSRFMKALARGYDYAVAHPGEAAYILLKNAPELDKELVQKSQRWLADKYRADASYWGLMKESVWNDFALWMKGYGLLSGDPDMSRAFTNEFLPGAGEDRK
ncbi:MAG: ABC transporter substrate-binding protein [Spirochaetales bacterium]|nr:ABC transporter substrate-binding protein [Spirochaetales bacterium]